MADTAAFEQQEVAQAEITTLRILEEKRLAEEKAKAELLAEQERIRLVGSPGENYPWANSSYYSNSPDTWGMYKRQCVSYTAWKVASSGRTMPYWGGRGNAINWDDNAIRAGIPVDLNPRIGDVAVDNFGSLGHVMFVEAVYSDGTIGVSQYNAEGNGRYSEDRVSGRGLKFIHF